MYEIMQGPLDSRLGHFLAFFFWGGEEVNLSQDYSGLPGAHAYYYTYFSSNTNEKTIVETTVGPNYICVFRTCVEFRVI